MNIELTEDEAVHLIVLIRRINKDISYNTDPIKIAKAKKKTELGKSIEDKIYYQLL